MVRNRKTRSHPKDDIDPLGLDHIGPLDRSRDGGVYDLLTPEIARSWLRKGIPSCREIVERHGMRKFQLSGFNQAFLARDRFIGEIGYGVPCREAIQACVKASPLLEVGAGTGFWAALIARAGGDILATDPGVMKYRFTVARHRPLVAQDGVSAVQANPDRNVLMVWPCYDENWAAQVARAMLPGRLLLLVSEGMGGCVGDDDLFRTLDHDFTLEETIRVPVWPGIGDYMTVHRKIVEG